MSLSKSNGWDMVWDKWKDHPDLLQVIDDHLRDGNYSCPVILNDWIERLLQEIDDLKIDLDNT